MNARLLKKLIQSIVIDNKDSLRKIVETIIDEEKKKGHVKLASDLEEIVRSKQQYENKNIDNTRKIIDSMTALPMSKRNNQSLATMIDYNKLKHNMVLSTEIEHRFDKIEKEYSARERLARFNLKPRKKILLYGPPGCGKTLGAERIAWNLGLPLMKVKFDAMISSYFGESASNLRAIFDSSNDKPCVLLLDECDFIAKSRSYSNDVGEIPRIVNTLLMLLDEYEAPGLLVATTNLQDSLDTALFRRFDEVIEMTKPTEEEIIKLFKQTLSAFKVDRNIKWDVIAEKVNGFSYSSIVKVAENSAKACILDGKNIITQKYIEISILEINRY